MATAISGELEYVREMDGMARIKVIGVGGGGSNAVSRMFRERVPSVEYMIINTGRPGACNLRRAAQDAHR